MPIIIDNSLLQPEEPQDDSAFGYAMMGLVEGVGAGIDKQRAQQEELAQFNREKDFELEKLRKEQEFNAPLQAAKIEEARTATAANKVALDAATLEAEAARRAAAAKQAREDAANRSRWAEAFGDGDVAKGESMLQDFDRRAAEAEAAGGREAGDRVRLELQRIGEEKHAIRQARKANEYIGSVLTSDIFKNDERLRLRADQILNDTKLGPVEKQSAVEGLVAEGKRKGAVARKKNNIIARVSERERVLQAKMDAETDPEIDAMYRAQIDDLHDYASEWDSIGEDDEEGAARLFENGSAMLRGSPSDAFYRRNGGRGAIEARSNSAAAFNDEMNFLKGLMDSGAFDEEQLKPLWQNLLARRVGNMAASGQLPGTSVNMNLGKTIMDDLLGNKKKDGDTPPVVSTEPQLTGPASMLSRFDKMVAERDDLQNKADDGIATDEELKRLTDVKAGISGLRNKAAVEIEGFSSGVLLGGTDYFFRKQLAEAARNQSPVMALQSGGVNLGLFGGAADLRSDLSNLTEQEIRSIRVPADKADYDRMVKMLKGARSEIVLDDLRRLGAERGFYTPTSDEKKRWSSKMSFSEGVSAIATGAMSQGGRKYVKGKPEGKPLTAEEASAATRRLYSEMPKGGMAEQPTVVDSDVSNQVREQELKAQAAESRRSARAAIEKTDRSISENQVREKELKAQAGQSFAETASQTNAAKARNRMAAESDQVREAIRTLTVQGIDSLSAAQRAMLIELLGNKPKVAKAKEAREEAKGPRTTIKGSHLTRERDQ